MCCGGMYWFVIQYCGSNARGIELTTADKDLVRSILITKLRGVALSWFLGDVDQSMSSIRAIRKNMRRCNWDSKTTSDVQT